MAELLQKEDNVGTKLATAEKTRKCLVFAERRWGDTLHCTVYSVQYTAHSMHYSVQCAVWCTVCSVMYSDQCSV